MAPALPPLTNGFVDLALRFRGRAGLTQRELAARIGVSERSVQAWEAGLSYPTLARLQLLIGVYLDENGFAGGHEAEEAEALWLAAIEQAPRQLPPFERAWFNELQARGSARPKAAETTQDVASDESSELRPDVETKVCDWGEAPDSSDFVGRLPELETLRDWVLDDHCRLVAVLGVGGVGKTRLAASVARNVAPGFSRCYWRSARNAPSATEWLAGAISLLSGQTLTAPDGEAARVSALLELLRSQRCLMVLDNFETLLQPGTLDGSYRADVGGYANLLRIIGQSEHQSCLMVTSREQPAEFAELKSLRGAVRVLELGGLDTLATRAMLDDKNLRGDDAAWAALSTRLAGNCLALKLVSQTIEQVFGGDIATFLGETGGASGIVYGGIRRLLDVQIGRSSPLERDVLRWLAIERDPVTLADLAGNFISLRRSELMEAVTVLRRRSLVEPVEAGSAFTLQSAVLEHVTDLLVEGAAHEIEQGAMHLLSSHALMKAESKDYVRRAQERLIVEPVLDRLNATCSGPRDIENRLLQMIDTLRRAPLEPYSYAAGNLVNLLRVLRGDLRGINLSGLRIRQAFFPNASMRDASISESDLFECVLADAFSWPVCVGMSGDGAFLAAGTSMGEVYLWRASDRMLVGTFRGHSGMILSVSLSGRGERLASCSDDGTVKLWDAQNGELLASFAGHVGGALAVAVNGDGRLVASGDGVGAIRVWNARDGRLVATAASHPEGIWGIAFDDAGNRLTSVSDSRVLVSDPESCAPIATLEGHHGSNFSAALSGDGRLVASGSFDGNVRVWEVDTGRLVVTLPGHASGAWSVALSGDGGRLVSGSLDGAVRAWDLPEGRIAATMQGHTGGVRSVALSRAGDIAASGSSDGTVRLWKADGSLIGELKGYTDGLRTIALSANAERCVTGSFDRAVRLWDVSTGRLTTTWQGHTGGVWAVAISPDGQTVASGGDDATVRVWRPEHNTPVAVLSGHSSAIWSLAVSADGQHVFSGSLDGTARIWSLQTNHVTVLDAQTGPVWGVALSRDATLLVSAGVAGMVTLWETTSGAVLKTFRAHTSPIFAVALSADARLLASASFDSTARLWETKSEDCVGVLEGHTGGVWSVALAPNGGIAATGGFDGIVRVWDTRTLQCLTTLRGHAAGVWSVAFDDAGRILASAGVDGAVVIWDVEQGAQLRSFRRDRLYERLDIGGVTGVTEAQREALFALGAVTPERPHGVDGGPG